MAIELKVPEMGESVVEVEMGEWLKSEGDFVAQDEPVVVIESDKVTLELPAPSAGKLTKITKQKGETVNVGDVVGELDPQAAPVTAGAASPEAPSSTPEPSSSPESSDGPVMPAAQRLLDEHGLSAAQVEASGPGGRLLKEDVMRHVEGGAKPASTPAPPAMPIPVSNAQREDVVPMSLMRRRIAERLVESQQTAALLTTFNEVDMSAVMALRNQYKQAFLDKYGIKLGFMSFFVKAAVDALKLIPQVNAEIRDQEIIFKNHYDIGIAVGGGRGLVVPVIRDADRLSFAQVELAIADFAKRARDNKLSLDELQGGTFTISNGGVYGSMMSTPIINPPQSGILGMHAIKDRPVAVDGKVEVRPVMYIALTYDHRIIDGRESVTFLKRIKEIIEQPTRMMLEI